MSPSEAEQDLHPFVGDATPDPRHERADQLALEHEPDRLPDHYRDNDWPEIGSVPVSVLIPVKNEQANIVECVRHLRWAEQVTVLDSQSSDDTIPLAQAMGAEVYQFYFSKDGWPKKRNWALEHVPWRNEWVLIVDADEHITPESARELARIARGEGTPRKKGCGDAYWINRKLIFMGRWIRGVGYYPAWNIRFFKHRLARYERIGTLGDTGSGDNEVHEHMIVKTGEAGYLEEDMLHYAYPDLTVWVEKHNRYTTWEAHAAEAGDEGEIKPRLLGSPIERRRWLKSVSRKLPFRPLMRFVYGYILQRGFMDGYPGFVLSRLMAWYEFMSVAKQKEMRLSRELERGERKIKGL
ncbi:MAG: glycosyltransferase family 2 protein [Planctomycetota bacterium]